MIDYEIMGATVETVDFDADKYADNIASGREFTGDGGKDKEKGESEDNENADA